MSELIQYSELNNAVAVLDNNKTRVANALNACQSTLAAMQQGLTDEIDQSAAELISKVKKTIDFVNNQRKPVTQSLDAIKKEFTSIEAELDPTKPGTVPYQIQQLRNGFAQQKLEHANLLRKQQEAEQMREHQKIQLRADIEIRLSNYFLTYKNDCHLEMVEAFNKATVNNFGERIQFIEAYNNQYPNDHFNQFFMTTVSPGLLSPDEVRWIKEEVMQGKFEAYVLDFQTNINHTRTDLLSRADSRYNELLDIEIADEAQRQILLLAQQQADKAEADRIALETAQQAEAVRIEAESTSQQSTLNLSFSKPTIEAPSRTGYEITVNNNAGYGMIYMFWFEREGIALAPDKIEKTSIGQMKAYAEKVAHKSDEKIKSPFLSYKEIVKAK